MGKPGPQMVDRYGVDFKITAIKLRERDRVTAFPGQGPHVSTPSPPIP